MERIIKVYKPCEQCKGRGLEWDGKYSSDCRVCQGYGEVMVSKRKEFENEQTNDRPKG